VFEADYSLQWVVPRLLCVAVLLLACLNIRFALHVLDPTIFDTCIAGSWILWITTIAKVGDKMRISWRQGVLADWFTRRLLVHSLTGRMWLRE
jgi:hypothetical protein